MGFYHCRTTAGLFFPAMCVNMHSWFSLLMVFKLGRICKNAIVMYIIARYTDMFLMRHVMCSGNALNKFFFGHCLGASNDWAHLASVLFQGYSFSPVFAG